MVYLQHGGQPTGQDSPSDSGVLQYVSFIYIFSMNLRSIQEYYYLDLLLIVFLFFFHLFSPVDSRGRMISQIDADDPNALEALDDMNYTSYKRYTYIKSAMPPMIAQHCTIKGRAPRAGAGGRAS